MPHGLQKETVNKEEHKPLNSTKCSPTQLSITCVPVAFLRMTEKPNQEGPGLTKERQGHRNNKKANGAPNGFYGEIDWDRYASPDVDEEGFSLRPGDEGDDILFLWKAATVVLGLLPEKLLTCLTE
ncbi:hypothetical protein PAMP_004570 [Pampus punctatissimus]